MCHTAGYFERPRRFCPRNPRTQGFLGALEMTTGFFRGQRWVVAFALLVAAGCWGGASGVMAADMVLIPAGDYTPLLRAKDDPAVTPVPAFYLEVRPVTNAEFLAFVIANPKWQRSRVSPLFADEGYLADWEGDLAPGAGAPAESPVVRVSWFAARAYAAWAGKRLPTTAEWERAASVGFTTAKGATEPAYRAAMLDWFARPSPLPLPAAGAGRPNLFGVRDLATLVWEWVADFNTALVTGESRGDTNLEKNLFCGSGAAGARDTTDYPAFMRAGFRSSLRANYVVPNLGFRCARSP